MTKQIAIVVGVGPEMGLGAALCRRFARGGLHVFVVGRSHDKLTRVVATIAVEGGSAEAVVTDATEATEVSELFGKAAAAGTIQVAIANAGNNKHIPFLDLKAEDLEAFWRAGCLSGFLVGREAARCMLPRGRGTILFTGASASLRGRPGFAHFSAAKAGLRMIAQSMAREFGPKGLHVAHVVIDGGIHGERLRQLAPDLLAKRGEASFLDIEPLAEAYLATPHSRSVSLDAGARPTTLCRIFLMRKSEVDLPERWPALAYARSTRPFVVSRPPRASLV